MQIHLPLFHALQRQLEALSSRKWIFTYHICPAHVGLSIIADIEISNQNSSQAAFLHVKGPDNLIGSSFYFSLTSRSFLSSWSMVSKQGQGKPLLLSLLPLNSPRGAKSPAPCQQFGSCIGSGGSSVDGRSVLPPPVRKMIFSIKVFVTLLDYLKIPQVPILGDLHV
jgi:hypothetical protein